MISFCCADAANLCVFDKFVFYCEWFCKHAKENVARSALISFMTRKAEVLLLQGEQKFLWVYGNGAI